MKVVMGKCRKGRISELDNTCDKTELVIHTELLVFRPAQATVYPVNEGHHFFIHFSNSGDINSAQNIQYTENKRASPGFRLSS